MDYVYMIILDDVKYISHVLFFDPEEAPEWLLKAMVDFSLYTGQNIYYY